MPEEYASLLELSDEQAEEQYGHELTFVSVSIGHGLRNDFGVIEKR